jgi:hypothetical protein
MKMRNTVIHATAIAFALAALPVLAQETTSETTTTTTTVRKHDYVYYGDHDIYFAPETKTYYWRDGSDWRSGAELPAESRTYITNGGVKIQLDTDRPYEKNEWVVEHYKHHDHD